MSLTDVKELIDTAGAEHCFLSTDYFFDLPASIPEQLKNILQGLNRLGVAYKDLEKLMNNTKKLFE